MARVAAADGIDVIAATPHIRHDHDVRIPELAGRVDEVNREIRDAGIAVEVVTGGEVAETALDGLSAETLLSGNTPLTCRLFRALFEHLLGFALQSSGPQGGCFAGQ
jgi:hypothetical protein